MAEAGVRVGRRAYAKGEARRAEILAAAVGAFAEQGYRGSSLRDIAAGTGVSASGILHHFGSKDALLTAVLEERERLTLQWLPTDPALAGSVGYFRNLVAYNMSKPGLVRLFATLAAEAADPEHPAHTWFVERYEEAREQVRTVLAEDLASLGEAEREATVQLFMAVSDGLQTQWLLDPERDMRAGMDLFVDLYRRGRKEGEGASAGPGWARHRRLGSDGATPTDRLESLGHHGRLTDGSTPSSFEAEAEAAVAALSEAIARRGYDWGDVVEVRTLHAELTDSALDMMGEVLRNKVGEREVPWLAQAAPDLASDGLRVEIGAVAMARIHN
ncbi:TetR family transcriptional regulator [Streptomyces sp. NPDC057474]|uniref:TetR family transcriptional regulator n=1 Tax=Streptomyces sp. NPDC057474 TaxID=3346144 RepID=UPI0036CA4085